VVGNLHNSGFRLYTAGGNRRQTFVPTACIANIKGHCPCSGRQLSQRRLQKLDASHTDGGNFPSELGKHCNGAIAGPHANTFSGLDENVFFFGPAYTSTSHPILSLNASSQNASSFS
jgi:hypothetical protein